MSEYAIVDSDPNPGTSSIPEGAVLFAERRWPIQDPKGARYIFGGNVFEDRGSVAIDPQDFGFFIPVGPAMLQSVGEWSSKVTVDAVTNSISITATNYDMPPLVTGSASSIEVLEEAASRGDDGPFDGVFRSMEWLGWSAPTYARAAKLALAAGALEFARQIASTGAALYRSEGILQDLAAILAAPQIIDRQLPSSETASLNLSWLAENGESFAGLWVALKDGELIASNERASELKRTIEGKIGLFVAKIPE